MSLGPFLFCLPLLLSPSSPASSFSLSFPHWFPFAISIIPVPLLLFPPHEQLLVVVVGGAVVLVVIIVVLVIPILLLSLFWGCGGVGGCHCCGPHPVMVLVLLWSLSCCGPHPVVVPILGLWWWSSPVIVLVLSWSPC